jgi:hypothetical protein
MSSKKDPVRPESGRLLEIQPTLRSHRWSSFASFILITVFFLLRGGDAIELETRLAKGS